jgi:hypothetical protein
LVSGGGEAGSGSGSARMDLKKFMVGFGAGSEGGRVPCGEKRDVSFLGRASLSLGLFGGSAVAESASNAYHNRYLIQVSPVS